MADVVRVAPLLRACLEVLREADGPLPRAEMYARMLERVDLTPYEQEDVGRGRPRWRVQMGWHTGDVATVGWMTKRDGYWALTDAGEAALDRYDADEFMTEVRQRLHEIRRQRAQAVQELSGVQGVIARALDVVSPGSWTSYDDLATLVGAPPEQIPLFLAGGKKSVPGSYRVLHPDGRLPEDGMVHQDQRGMDLAKKLRSEGVEFDGDGRATQAQRMTASDIEEHLAELDQPDETEPAVRRAWLVRGSSVDGRDLVPVWLQKGTASLAAGSLRAVTPPVPRDELRAIVEADYQHKSYAVRETKLAEFDAFCNRMRPGDHVLTTSQGKAYLGRITGDAYHVQSSDQRSNLRRTVEWSNPTRPVPFAHLPQPLPAKLHSQSDVVELTEDIAAIDELLAALGVRREEEHIEVKPELRFPDVTQALADDLFVDRDWLSRQTDLLWDRKQLIFYGPPGTGKTYIARKLAAHLAEPSAVKLVQFHPSYTYEDFFEGFRPVKRTDGQLAFELRPGPFRRLVEAARQHPGDPYILIIDEINRANLAKVFGELYFLLEYRDDAIGLLYSAEDDFTLPPNVFVIGTMNTTDRSIALVDAAMRRRFAFVELHPTAPPVVGVLRDWLAQRVTEEALSYNLDAPDLLDALNEEIEEHDLAIGPSFLMRVDVYRRADGLARVWETSILPLLAEYHYGSPSSVLDRYRIPSLRKKIAARNEQDGAS